MMRPWWERIPQRLLIEDLALRTLAVGQDAITLRHRWTREPDGEPRAIVDLSIRGDLVLEIRFPKHYPEACPSVRPVPYDTPISSHQFKKSGILCLEYGPDNWHPRLDRS